MATTPCRTYERGREGGQPEVREPPWGGPPQHAACYRSKLRDHAQEGKAEEGARERERRKREEREKREFVCVSTSRSAACCLLSISRDRLACFLSFCKKEGERERGREGEREEGVRPSSRAGRRVLHTMSECSRSCSAAASTWQMIIADERRHVIGGLFDRTRSAKSLAESAHNERHRLILDL